MTKEEIDIRLSELDSERNSLISERESLEKELKTLIELKDVSKFKKDDLKREVSIRRRLEEIETELVENQETYDLLADEYQDVLEEERAEERRVRRSKGATAIGIIALAGIMAVATVAGVKGCKKTNDKSIVSQSTPTPEDDEDLVVVTPTSVVTAEPTSTPEPTVAPVLVDVTNDEDVEKAADRIMTEEVNSIVESENDEVFANSFNNETIEDIIRVVNGELPKYSEYDEYTIGETANMMNDILANRGSVGNKLYPVHFSKLYPDGSREAEYVETYDEVYNMIAKYRAEENVDGFIEQVGELGKKLYKEWHLAGLYGGWNPYLFKDEEHYFLLQAATSRFSNYVREYLEANDLTVCIETCYNPETQEYKLVEVRDIFEAMYMGTSRNGEISVLRSGEVINIFAETYADAKNYLDSRAQENVKVLK